MEINHIHILQKITESHKGQASENRNKAGAEGKKNNLLISSWGIRCLLNIQACITLDWVL